MPERARPIGIPQGSVSRGWLPGATFHDCHALPLAPGAGPALQLYLAAVVPAVLARALAGAA